MPLAVHTRSREDGGRPVVVDLDGTELDVQPDRSGHFHVGRQPDAELLGVAVGAPAGLFGPQLRVAGGQQRGVERLLVLAGVVAAAGRRRERELARLEEVHAADLGRVHAELVGRHVEHALDELRRLRAPRAPIGADRGVVGQQGGGLEPHGRDVVHAHRHHLGEHGQDRPDPRVGPGRRHDRAVEADDLAGGRQPELGRHHVVAAVHERDHVLRPTLRPLHRTAQRQRRGRRDEVLDVGRRLRTEAAPDPGAHDTELVRFETQQRERRHHGSSEGPGARPSTSRRRPRVRPGSRWSPWEPRPDAG